MAHSKDFLRCFGFGVLLFLFSQNATSTSIWVIESDGVTVEIAPSDSWVIERTADLKAPPPVEQIQGGTYYRLIDNQIKVESDGAGTSFTKIALSLVNQAGVDNNSSINLEFDPTYQSLRLHSLDVIRDGRRIDNLHKARIVLLSRETALDQNLYSGAMTLNILLEDILPGDSLEYSYSLAGFNPVYQGIFSYSRSIQFSVPIERQFVRVLWGKPTPLRADVVNADLDVQKTSAGKYQEYSIKAASNSTLKVSSQTPHWYSPFGAVYFNEVRAWEDVVNWAAPMYEISAPSDDIAAIASDIRAANDAREARVLAALSFVQTNIRYVGIEIGQNSHFPTAPQETLRLKYGDCKDKVVLLLAILKALDVEAFPALVNTGIHDLIRELPATPNLFDHVIVFLEHDGEAVWIDPTLSHQLGGFESLYQPDYGFALVLRSGENDLRSMARDTYPDSQWVRESYSIPVSFDSPVSFNVETVDTGYSAMQMQWQIEENGLAAIAEDYEDFYQQSFPSLRSTGPLDVQVDSKMGTITLLEKYLIPDFWIDGEEHWEANFYPSAIRAALLLPDEVQRNDPFSLSYPKKLKMTLSVTFEEEGWEFEESDYLEDNDFFVFSQQARFTDGSLIVEYLFRTKTDSVPAARLSEYLEARKSALDNASYGVLKYREGGASDDADPFTSRVALTVFLLTILLLAFVILDWRRESRRRPHFEGAVFFPVAAWKFALFSVLSFGVYTSYWMYRNWRFVRDETRQPMMPIVRGIFSYIWVYPLYLRLRADSEAQYSTNRVLSTGVAVFCTCAFAIASFSSGLGYKTYMSQLSLGAPLLLLPFVNYINSRNDALDGALDFNSRWLLRHTAACLFLVPILFVWVLALSPLLPTGRVVPQSSLMQRDLAFMYRQQVVPSGEEIQYFYSGAFLDLRNDGNGFTANRVFSYWREDKRLYIESALLRDVKDISVEWSGNDIDDSVITVIRNDDTSFVLLVATHHGGDKIFEDGLMRAWKQSRLD